MTLRDDEIAKLARAYAEEIYPHEEFEDIGQMDFLRNTAQKNAMDFMQFLLRTHCIVSKGKVKGIYDEANQGDAYDRFDNGYNLGVVDTLESLFDAETFKSSEV